MENTIIVSTKTGGKYIGDAHIPMLTSAEKEYSNAEVLEWLVDNYGDAAVVKHAIKSIVIAAQAKMRAEYKKGGPKKPDITVIQQKWFEADEESWREAAAEGPEYLATCANRWYNLQPQDEHEVTERIFKTSELQ